MSPTEDPAPRIALVTGASSGLGLDIARRLARDGCHVILTATRQAAIERLASTLLADGAGTVEGMELDVQQEDSVARLFGQIDRRHGRLDILVNNAGIAPRVNGAKSRVEDTTLADWNRTLAVNLTGTFLVTRAALPLLKRSRSGGRIINISSRGGRTRSILSSAHYAASKAGLLGFARILADEVGPLGITVNTVAPSRISTPMARTVADASATDAQFIAETPLGRLGIPADVSAVVAFLASPEAGFLTGTIIDVAGGQFMP